MGIVGSVLVTPTISSNTETAETASFPNANMTVVKVWHGATYVKIPLDSSRDAYLPSCGGAPGGSSTIGTLSTGRPVHFTINGTKLNYSVYAVGTSPNIAFYYGTALKNSKPLSAFAAVIAVVTLSSGSGSGTWSFPSGNLKLNAVSATMGLAAASTGIEISWNTSSGQTLEAFIVQNIVTQSATAEDLLEVDLPVSQTVSISLSAGTGADKVVAYAFYQ